MVGRQFLMRAISVIFAMLIACETTPEGSQTTPTETETAQTETGVSNTIVWEQMGGVSSVMNNGVFATTTGAWVVNSEGQVVYLDNSGKKATAVIDVDAPLLAIWGEESGTAQSMTAVGESGWIAQCCVNAETVDLGTANLSAVGGNSAVRVAIGWGGAYSNTGAVGEEWLYETLPSGAQINAIYVGEEQIFGVGSQGAIIERTTAGEWFSAFSPTNYDLRAIAGNADSNVWAVGDFGKILHYDGATWTELKSDIAVTLWGVWVATTGEVFVVGNNGYAAKYDGKGVFEQLPTGVISNLYGVDGVNAEQVWAVGSQGEVLKLSL